MGTGVLFLLWACKKEEPKTPDYLSPVASEVTGVWIGRGVGTPGSVSVPVFATNDQGAPVPAASLPVTGTDAAGAAISLTVAPDGGGWGTAEISSSGPGTAILTAEAGGASATGSAWALTGAPGEIEFPTAEGRDVEQMAGAGFGFAWSIGNEVWWGVPGGAPPVRVLSLAGPVLEMNAVQVDADGATDLLVRSEGALILLRGRDGGGLTWGAGFDPGDADLISAATVTDLDGDSVNDMLLALQSGTTTRILWCIGDGLWGFTQESVLEVLYPVSGVSAEDYTVDGSAEVTLLTIDGLLRRFALYDGTWVSATTADYELELGLGARLLPSADVNGDNIPDVLAYGPLASGTGAQAWVVTAGAASPTRYRLFGADAIPSRVAMTAGDLDQDGVQDLALLADGKLLRVIWGAPQESPTVFNTGGLPDGAALAIGSFVGDDWPDIAIGAARVVGLPGAFTTDDPNTADTDEGVPWRVQTPGAQGLALDIGGDPWVGDFNGDGIVDVIAGIQGDASVGLRAFTGDIEGNGTLTAAPLVVLADSGEVLDIAVCGDQVHLLLDDTTPTLYRYTVAADGQLGEALAPVEIPDARLVDCGSFPAGDVVVATGSSLLYLDPLGFQNPGEPSTNIVDIAVWDADGDGIDAVAQCKETGCALAAADLDGDGADDLAHLAEGALTVETAAGTFTASEDADGLWAGDIDGDGTADLSAGAGGYWRAWRTTAAGLAPEAGRFLWWPTSSRIAFGDLNGDGSPDLLTTGREDDSTDAVDWTGRLIVSM